MKAIFNTRGFYQQSILMRQMCTFNTKDLVRPGSNQPATDLLLQNLKNASNTKSILDIVAQHNRIMNNKHIIQALRSLFTLQKCGSSQYSTREILGHPNFSKLCYKLKQQAGAIELRETIEALKVVSYVGVPSDSTIIQVLLQLIRHNANQLNLQQIMFMDFLLKQFKPTTPLIQALKIALPIIFEVNLLHKLEYENVNQLADCLYYASKNCLTFEIIQPILASLVSNHKHQHFDCKVSKSLVWSLCDLEPNEALAPLLKKALKSLVTHLDDMNYNDIETTLSKLAHKYSSKYDFYYDEVFFDSCANYLIENDLGFEHSIYILRKLNRLVHVNNNLLDYMATKIYEKPDLIENADVPTIFTIAVSVSVSEYRPRHWDLIKTLIENYDDMAACDRKEIIWLKFAASLCLLKIFKPDVLSKCLNEIFLSNLLKQKFQSNFEYYLTIWHSITLYKPELAFLLPKRFLPEIILKRFKQELDFPLKGALNKALGGDKYVKTDLDSKTGYQIDHAVVFRKGGFPVALNYPESLEFIEDIEIPQDSQLVLIQVYDSLKYTINRRQIRASTVLESHVLESKGFTVIPICLEVWENLQDYEKIPFLMQTIKEKLDCGLSISENVI